MRGSRIRAGLKLRSTGLPIGFLIVVVTLLPDAAQAYIGPGSGLSAIGSVLAVLAAGFFAIVGFIWYPIKRVVRLAFGRRNERSER